MKHRQLWMMIGMLWWFALPNLFALTDKEIAIALTNPLAKIISIPFAFNYSQNINLEYNGKVETMDIQPLVPIKISKHWDIVSRFSLPVVNQQNSFVDSGTQFGLGPSLYSGLLSPDARDNKMMWGIGPTVWIPTNTQDILGDSEWGIGPSGLIVTVKEPWTFKLFVEQLWTVGPAEKSKIFNLTGVNPAISYTTDDAFTLTLSPVIEYDWSARASITSTATAPAAIARWRITSKSPPWPTSIAIATTS